MAARRGATGNARRGDPAPRVAAVAGSRDVAAIPAAAAGQNHGYVVGAAALATVTLVAIAAAIASFLRAEDFEQRWATTATERDAARTDADQHRQTAEAMAGRLGLRPDDPAALRAKLAGDAAARGVATNYPARVDELLGEVERTRLRIEGLTNDAGRLRGELRAANGVGEARVKTLREGISAKDRELLDVQKVAREEVADLQARLEAARKELEDLRGRGLQAKNGHEKSLGERDRQIKDLQAALRALKREAGEGAAPAEELAAPAGAVIAMDQGAGRATIGFGRDAGARVGMSLRLHRAALGKPARQVATATIVEIDARSCRATVKLLENTVAVVAGDLAIAPLAEGGEIVGVAGKVALDRSGADGFDDLKRALEKNGATIAFRLDPGGLKTGAISPRMKCLIMDEAPAVAGPKDPRRAYQELLAAARSEAANLGVRIVGSKAFLAELGYRQGRVLRPVAP